MDAGFLERLLGGNRKWSNTCVVIIEAEASVKTPGPDSISTGGMKTYAPRVSSGRLPADTVCLMKEEGVLLAVEQIRSKDAVGQSHLKQTLMVVDVKHVVAIEFDSIDVLQSLDIAPPPEIRAGDYRPGTLVG